MRTNYIHRVLAILVVLCTPLWASALSRPVGEVSLVIGRASVLSSHGAARALERGAPLHVGDRIETPASAHVHVRFVDGGTVSIRPNSRVWIEDYRDPTQGSDASVRLRLEEGVMRSVTGRWGEAHKERFRLNTPLAAIGVRGTDFAVQSNADRTAATVFSGGIIVSAQDARCAAQAGPCLNGSERLLTAEMKGQMLELNRAQAAPQLVPSVDLLVSSGRSAAPNGARRAEALAVETARLTLLSAQQVGSSSSGGAAPPSASGAASSDNFAAVGVTGATAALAAGVDRSTLQSAVANNAAQSVTKPPVVTQLAWARLGEAWPGDNLSQGFDSIPAGYGAVVGNLRHTLMSQGPTLDARQTLAGGEAVVNLRLANAGATLLDPIGRTLEGVAVNAGALSLDFLRARFATRLNLSSPQIGEDTFTASGVLQPNGTFFFLSDKQFLAGTVTAKGQEAGYLFEKRVAPGVVKGITLWGR